MRLNVPRPMTVQPQVVVTDVDRTPSYFPRFSLSDVSSLAFRPSNGQDLIYQPVRVARANSYTYTPKVSGREASWGEAGGDNSVSAFPMLSVSRTCAICTSLLVDQSKVSIPQCEHLYCRPCIIAYLELRVSNGEVLKMPCPTFECTSTLADDQLQALLTSDVFTKYATFKRNLEIESNPNVKHCPKPDCTGYAEGGVERTKLVCNRCGHVYCFYCQEPWHDGEKCGKEMDRQLDSWAKANRVKFCPNCHRRVEKMSGCDHMTCVKCRYDWCWKCGQEYTPAHDDICVVSKSRKRNPPWVYILALIFAPALLPFALILLVLYYVEELMVDLEHREDQQRMYRFLKSRWISYPVLIILSIVVTPLAFGVVILFGGCFVILESRVFISSSETCLKGLLSRRWLWVLLSILVGLMLSPVVVACLLVGVVVAHVLGVLFLLFKTYIALRRCCDPKYFRPQGAPGYLF